MVLTVLVEDALAREQVAEALVGVGGSSIEEVEGGLRTYLPPSGEVDSLHDRASAVLSEIPGVSEDGIAWEWRLDEDWTRLWKEGLAPRSITPRLVVCPSWCTYDRRPGEHVIILDPGMAFGTAEHGTTRGCLRLLDSSVTPGERILDAGTGSGILSIAAAMLGAGEVLGVESDESASPTARDNVEANGVAAVVQIESGIVTPTFLLESAPWDGIVANIKTTVLTPLLSAFHDSLSQGGWLILSGILEEEWRAVVEEAERAGLVAEADDPDGEWRSGRFRGSVMRP